MRTIVKNIGLLATPLGKQAQKGQDQANILFKENAYIVIEDEIISEVGSGKQINWQEDQTTTIVDAQKQLVTPGLVDAHTHLVFGGWRQKELPLKLKGSSYLEILAAGGGILSTVKNTQTESEDNLFTKASSLLDNMLKHGTTTCEVKSGYGLTVEDEVKSLRVIKKLSQKHLVDIAATFMGAHAVPTEYKDKQSEYVKLVCEQMIPCIAKEKLAEFCDVFCETGVFSVEESRQILKCGLEHGLQAKIHAEEITELGGTKLAGEIGAISAEHLIHASKEGIEALANGKTTAVLLPGTSFYLNEAFANARQMIGTGVPIAVATDFNPGSCPCESLQMPMTLACLKYRLYPEEILTAVTLNAAAAIDRSEHIGSIEEGKQGDIIIWEAPDLNYLFYRWGINQVKKVIKKGQCCVAF